jgi:hypothetical protein
LLQTSIRPGDPPPTQSVHYFSRAAIGATPLRPRVFDKESIAMPSHKYAAGRKVQFGPRELHLSSPGQFEIVRAMPIEHGILQYRIKSLKDGHQRIVMESDLS